MSTELLSITPHSYATAAVKPAVVLPLQAAGKAAAAPANDDSDDGAALGRAIEELNRYVAGSRTDLRFALDHDAGQMVVSIIDAESGQVLRQMPSLEALRIARYLEHDRMGLIRQRA